MEVKLTTEYNHIIDRFCTRYDIFIPKEEVDLSGMTKEQVIKEIDLCFKHQYNTTKIW